jgi:threonine aldolase
VKGFGSDNHAGVHPRILEALWSANQGHAPSYGSDTWTEQAVQELSKLFGKDVPVFFVYNGTAANALALRSMVKPWQAILCSELAHLNMDECGAPEFLTGAKLYPLPCVEAKLTVEILQNAMIRRGDQHSSQAKAVSLTQPTELGTCYTIQEMKDICTWAHQNGMYVHVDGARIANSVVHLQTDFKTLFTDAGVDVISFGGTKNGLLMGEAVVFLNSQLAQDFVFSRKQIGQLPSKTRFISSAFTCYLHNGLWKEIASHTLSLAQKLADQVRDIPGVCVTQKVQSNAVFATIPQKWVKPLREKYFFYVWDEKTFECRWMISFDTTAKEVDSFAQALRQLSQQGL